jgi:hypothetical protein
MRTHLTVEQRRLALRLKAGACRCGRSARRWAAGIRRWR